MLAIFSKILLIQTPQYTNILLILQKFLSKYNVGAMDTTYLEAEAAGKALVPVVTWLMGQSSDRDSHSFQSWKDKVASQRKNTKSHSHNDTGKTSIMG